MTTHYSNNDWRYFLEHKEGSKYDWSSGKNPSDYNHDYWEQHKEEILAKRRQKNGAVRDFDGAGVGYKAKKDGTHGFDDSDFENDEDWSDELTEDELKNIDAHNKQVDDNIAALTKTVEDYITANKDKLTNDQIKKLRDDLNTQTNIAREQKINTKNSDDYNYVMGLRKKSGSSKSSNSVSKPKTSSGVSARSTGTKSSGKSNKKLGASAAKDVSATTQRNEQLEERRRRTK